MGSATPANGVPPVVNIELKLCAGSAQAPTLVGGTNSAERLIVCDLAQLACKHGTHPGVIDRVGFLHTVPLATLGKEQCRGSPISLHVNDKINIDV